MAELVYSKTMAMTAADFFRLLPEIAPKDSIRTENTSIRYDTGHGSLRIDYHEKKSMKIGAIILPQLQLHFSFTGYTAEEADTFMKKFEAVYRRGGG